MIEEAQSEESSGQSDRGRGQSSAPDVGFSQPDVAPLANRFADQIVVVTGAAGGLGSAMAWRFRAEGAHVVLCDRNADGLAKLAEHLEDTPGEGSITAAVVDVRQTPEVDAFIDATLTARGRIDALINNAGRFVDRRIENMDDDAWSEVIDINLTGAFRMIRAAFPAMKRAKYGRFVSIASLSAGGNFGQANYSAAKAGIVGVARTLALEGATYGVTSNVISPGSIMTPMLRAMKTSVRDRMCAGIPMKRIGDPADIAAATAFLASRESAYITGVVLEVDGGLSVPFIRHQDPHSPSASPLSGQ